MIKYTLPTYYDKYWKCLKRCKWSQNLSSNGFLTTECADALYEHLIYP